MQTSKLITALAALCLPAALSPAATAAQICGGAPCVNSTDIIDGQVKTPDLANTAVTDAKLLEGAVTGLKVANNTLDELDFSVAQRVVVARSGGDFSSISAALAAISPIASAPYVVEVMPGIYTELSGVRMKSFVHLRGAGREVVTIRGNPSSFAYVITIPRSTSNVLVSGLTLEDSGSGGINIEPSTTSVTLRENRIRANGRDFPQAGVRIASSGASISILDNIIRSNKTMGISVFDGRALISGNTITDNDIGIHLHASGSDAPIITGNVIANSDLHGITITSGGPGPSGNSSITMNTITGNAIGIRIRDTSSPTIIGNRITENRNSGIQTEDSSMPQILHNRIDGNGIATGAVDIVVGGSSAPHISYNIYNDISGTSGAGQFNLQPDGAAAPAP